LKKIFIAVVDNKTSICQSHQRVSSSPEIASFPLCRDVEWKMQNIWNTTLKTVGQY